MRASPHGPIMVAWLPVEMVKYHGNILQSMEMCVGGMVQACNNTEDVENTILLGAALLVLRAKCRVAQEKTPKGALVP